MPTDIPSEHPDREHLYAARRTLCHNALRQTEVWEACVRDGSIRSIYPDWVRVQRLQASDYVAVVGMVYKFSLSPPLITPPAAGRRHVFAQYGAPPIFLGLLQVSVCSPARRAGCFMPWTSSAPARQELGAMPKKAKGSGLFGLLRKSSKKAKSSSRSRKGSKPKKGANLPVAEEQATEAGSSDADDPQARAVELAEAVAAAKAALERTEAALRDGTAASHLQRVARGKAARSASAVWPVFRERASWREHYEQHEAQRVSRAHAAEVLQGHTKRMRARRLRSGKPLRRQQTAPAWMPIGSGSGEAHSSRLSTRDFAKQLDQQQSIAHEEDTLNPLSRHYVGPEEHRRIVESKHGKFTRYGNPTQKNVERALPGQVATLLNVLAFVDVLNALLSQRLVATACLGGASATFEELVAWEEGALQARFSGAAQYLKAAKKYGLLRFDGEMPLGCVIESHSVGRSRQQLLARVLTRPQLIGASMDGKELVRRILGPEFEVQVSAAVSAPLCAAPGLAEHHVAECPAECPPSAH